MTLVIGIMGGFSAISWAGKAAGDEEAFVFNITFITRYDVHFHLGIHCFPYKRLFINVFLSMDCCFYAFIIKLGDFVEDVDKE